jgi:hypothetical protein
MDSADPSRPTPEPGARRAAASATDGVASPVGACEIELNGSPQEAQNRASAETSEEQVGQRINGRKSYSRQGADSAVRSSPGRCSCYRTAESASSSASARIVSGAQPSALLLTSTETGMFAATARRASATTCARMSSSGSVSRTNGFKA